MYVFRSCRTAKTAAPTHYPNKTLHGTLHENVSGYCWLTVDNTTKYIAEQQKESRQSSGTHLIWNAAFLVLL